jgi:diguanylate cyclase (GGDEF)-like protein/putative nucleotidyltransferase with HDIG domain
VTLLASVASRLGAATGRDEEGRSLSGPAAAFFVLVAAAAAAASGPFLGRLDGDEAPLATFLVLAGCAACAQIFPVLTPRNYSYQTTGVFLIPAVLLLPPELLPLVALVQHIPDWLKARHPWFIQTFNICNYTLALLAAWGSARLALGPGGADTDSQVRFALAGLAAALVFGLVNHSLLAAMLRLARGLSVRDSGLFAPEALTTELVIAALGVAVATLWQANPWLIPFALAPLLLIHRALAVPALQAEARIDPKTGLFNARHFTAELNEELARAKRFERPLSLIMADLDLLRDVNNTHGHLAGDAVLRGIAEVFRAQLRHYDVPARFGGEEFSILLPETPPEQALEIAERIRRAVAQTVFAQEVAGVPVRVTMSLGVAGFPRDASEPMSLLHEADVAVYRAKLQGRNRVLVASSEPLLVEPGGPARRSHLRAEEEALLGLPPVPSRASRKPAEERRRGERRRSHRPLLSLPEPRLGALAGLVGAFGLAGGAVGLLAGGGRPDLAGLVALVVLVGAGRALALDMLDEGSISVSAVGILAGAAMFGPRAALVLALTTCAVDWSARRTSVRRTLYNAGAISAAGLAAAGIFAAVPDTRAVVAASGLAAGAVYFLVKVGLLGAVLTLDRPGQLVSVVRSRFGWLLPHYLAYGFVGAVIAIAYDAVGAYGVVVFAVPLLLLRRTQSAYLDRTERSASRLRHAAETIQSENVSLERANRLLRERSTAAMAMLSANVDVRDSFTAGHARRVQALALAIGGELGLSEPELELLSHAALFHDIGKYAVPDAILLKPAELTPREQKLMRRHAEEGARIIDRLGFLGDAVPAIRHHHERWDGAGYPAGLEGEEIPLGARVIHVADALDSMLTGRSYRGALSPSDALAELRSGAGSQFCPRCVTAVEGLLERVEPEGDRSGGVAASAG